MEALEAGNQCSSKLLLNLLYAAPRIESVLSVLSACLAITQPSVTGLCCSSSFSSSPDQMQEMHTVPVLDVVLVR